MNRQDAEDVHGLRVFSMAQSGRPRCFISVGTTGSANDVDRDSGAPGAAVRP